MGMAASQARYLALVARKSNCEYEGQQINQARTALANQSANLFNQMLGLQVPVPPSTQDFTKTQYSFTDGLNASTIDSWQQLGNKNSEYNYVVTHHYYADRYTGSLKKMSDPQVQFPTNFATLAQIQDKQFEVAQYEKAYNEAVKAYEDAIIACNEAQAEMQKLSNYKASDLTATAATGPSGTPAVYTITDNAATPVTHTFKAYADLSDADKATISEAVEKLQKNHALTMAYDINNVYYDGTNIAFKEDLDAVVRDTTFATTLPLYTPATIDSKYNELKNAYDAAILERNNANLQKEAAAMALEGQKNEYLAMAHPESIGNCDLTPLSTLTPDQRAEIDQIVADMKEQGIDTDINNCFNSAGDYVGGIYQFKLNGITYFTTYNNLMESYENGVGNNHIDEQPKLAYYNASYVSTKVEKTQNALVETDGAGRFTSIKFEDDSVTYTLNMETITDDVAYQDAMNQYYYENAKYDKMVQDINAKTSIIHQEDRTLELRLKQLETEQNALKTEIDAVQGIVKDNVEKSFKTFSG